MIRDRAIAFPDDVWAVRDFVSELWRLAPLGTVWEVRRWEGSVFHAATPHLAPERAARSRLWVDDSERIVAAALSEGGRQIHPHVHPEAAELLEPVVAWAEDAAAAVGDDAVLLHVWDGDEPLREIAIRRGYEETAGWESARLLRVAETPPPEIPPGYELRATRDEWSDDRGIAELLNDAFGRTIHFAAEHAGFARHAQCFRRETDLVAEAPDGSLAAYAAVCWDWRNRHAIFEPVCTHPEHRRRGLARALMLEGLHRARALGALTIEVGTGDADPANGLYASLPFTDVRSGRFWRREL